LRARKIDVVSIAGNVATETQRHGDTEFSRTTRETCGSEIRGTLTTKTA